MVQFLLKHTILTMKNAQNWTFLSVVRLIPLMRMIVRIVAVKWHLHCSCHSQQVRILNTVETCQCWLFHWLRFPLHSLHRHHAVDLIAASCHWKPPLIVHVLLVQSCVVGITLLDQGLCMYGQQQLVSGHGLLQRTFSAILHVAPLQEKSTVTHTMKSSSLLHRTPILHWQPLCSVAVMLALCQLGQLMWQCIPCLWSFHTVNWLRFWSSNPSVWNGWVVLYCSYVFCSLRYVYLAPFKFSALRYLHYTLLEKFTFLFFAQPSQSKLLLIIFGK